MKKYDASFKFSKNEIIEQQNKRVKILDCFYKYQNGDLNKRIKFYNYQCLTCSYVGEMSEYDIINAKYGCPCCASRIVVYGINDITTTAPWMVKYFIDGHDEAKLYNKTSNKKIYLKCPDCGKIKTTKMTIGNLYYRKSINCDCGDGVSYPEKFMSNILTYSGVKFIPQYSPKWIKPKRYDFYLLKENVIIEMDGHFHSKENTMNKDTYEDVVKRDKLKDDLAKENNIKVIRIDCKIPNFENIRKNIINSQLSNYINLENVDWMGCDEKSQRNTVKDVCEYYMETKDSTVNIAEKFNLSATTVVKYLKKGKMFEWCDYDSKESSFKRARSHGDKLSKAVLVYKNGELLGEYKSTADLKRKSLEDFGVQFSLACISYTCNGIQPSHKGYELKYKQN